MNFEDHAKELILSLIDSGEVEAVLGEKTEHGRVIPALFKTKQDLENLVLSSKYGVAQTVIEIQKTNPEQKLGVIVHGCDERALIELAKQNKVDLSKLRLIGVACSEENARACFCYNPNPSRVEIGMPLEGLIIAPQGEFEVQIDALEKMTVNEKLEFWKYQFSKCIKCYACRDNCPTCVCDQCILEDDMWVKKGVIPPEFPSFHLIRMYHMTQKCTGCGECEAACPVEIPLLTIQYQIINDMIDLFEFEAGESREQLPPLNTSEEDVPLRGDEC
ncbi:MAG: 4Fe-4S binding protein [Thermoplasmata archaeon]|nr:MAG: 4Fe-4S binding protein [Thermoplasmata archaeon]